MDKLCETIAVYLGDETAFAENLMHVDRRVKFQPSWNENIRVHGAGLRNLE
jgi:hypothetical protein